MIKRELFDNPVRRQVFSLPDLIYHEIDVCFGKGMQDLMSIAEMFDARKVYITGCGDSFAAAVAFAPLIEKYCDCFGVVAVSIIEFTRFMTKGDIGIGEPNSPIVIVISASGGASRISEALEKANALGAFSILFTNNSDSKAVKLAKRVFNVETPSFAQDSPGLRSYVASMLAEIGFAARMGLVRGTLQPSEPDKWKTSLRSFSEAYRETLDEIDDLVYSVADKWKTFERFDFIGDGVDFGSAFYSAATIVECVGDNVSYSDSEDWCHINYFLKNPETIGTVVFADKYSNSFDRAVETIGSAKKIGRPVLVVTNADKNDFIDGVVVCTLPDGGEEFAWMAPLFNFIPGALLSGYLAAMKNRAYFRMKLKPDGEIDFENPFYRNDVMTLKNSEIVIVD